MPYRSYTARAGPLAALVVLVALVALAALAALVGLLRRGAALLRSWP
jgi:hypothetical protein